MKTYSTRVSQTTIWGRILPLSRKRRQMILLVVLLIGDILAIGAAFWVAYQLRFTLLPYRAPFSLVEYQRLVFGIIPVWIIIFSAFQLYNSNHLLGGLEEYSRVVNAVTGGIGALILLGFLRRDDLTISRGWLIISWLAALSLVWLARFSIRRAIFSLRDHGHFLSPTILVGANNEGRALAEQLRDTKTSGLYITGFIDDSLPYGSTVANGFKVIGNLQDLERIVQKSKIEDVVIAPTALSRDQLLNIYRMFNPKPDVKLRLSSGLFEVLNTGLRVKELAFVPLIEVNQTRITGFDAFMKAALDYSVTMIGLVLGAPVLLLLALAVRLDSPGPILYRRRVMGTNGTQFNAFKFRTMHVNGQEILENYPELKAELDQLHKLKDDPRVTRVGGILRKFSLDELPQLFNVLFGQMSLVGPRMISPPEMAQYGQWGMNLLTVKPGITGLWQVSGRSDISYEERVRLDMYYIRNWTIWSDLYLLLATLPVVLKKKGAY